MRFSAPSLLHCIAWAALAGLGQGAWAADCVGMRGGDLLLTASDHCLGQMRREAAVRRQMVQAIEVGGAAPARTVPVSRGHDTARASQANLTHPLSRLSQLNAQSRYLWAMGNPAGTYYGQAR